MASSTTEIANLALGHLGIGKDIANLDTESSQEAKAMRRYYDICRRTVLQEFTWPFATKFVTLGLVEEDPTDAEEWAFSYRYPADCLFLRRLHGSDHYHRRNPHVIRRHADEREDKVEQSLFSRDG